MDHIYKTDAQLHVHPAYYSGGVPVFTPTMTEFQDFYAYNKAINKFGMQSGIVKIIPPLEWTQLLEGTYTRDNLENVRIKNPIVQNMNSSAGHQGVFSLQNVEKQRSYNIFQWKELSLKPNFVPPAKKTRRALSAPSSKSPEPNKTREITDISNKYTSKLLCGDFNIDVSEFTPERCEELEQLYWKSLGYAEPMYGADMLGSLFQQNTSCWNVAQLPNILDLMEEKIPGVNDAYLYAGLWKASFSWHLEDQDLYSINYLHFGAPKQWYSIPQRDNAKFYNLMKDVFSEDYKNCLEFLRHKTFLASPQYLAKNGVECNHIVHNQGEFMITYPYGYHAGFNFGFNLAESVNFALDDWFEFAPKTQKCECIHDAVGINYKQLYCKLKGLPYVPEALPQEDKERTPQIEPIYTPTSQPVPRKPAKKKSKVELREYECALCPNNLPDSLTVFNQFELLDTDALNPHTRKPLQVHRICARAFPKYLRFRRPSRTSKIASERVSGLLSIPRSMRSVKCSVCHIPNRITQSSKAPLHGACFQCRVPKCNRSFHATCSLANGALVDDFLCRQHRSSVSPFYLACDSLDLVKKLGTIPPNSMIQFTLTQIAGKPHSGDAYCGLVTQNSKEDETLQVVVFPKMDDELEVQYKNVLMGKAETFDNSQLLGMTGTIKNGTSLPLSAKKHVDGAIPPAKRPKVQAYVENMEDLLFQPKFPTPILEHTQDNLAPLQNQKWPQDLHNSPHQHPQHPQHPQHSLNLQHSSPLLYQFPAQGPQVIALGSQFPLQHPPGLQSQVPMGGPLPPDIRIAQHNGYVLQNQGSTQNVQTPLFHPAGVQMASESFPSHGSPQVFHYPQGIQDQVAYGQPFYGRLPQVSNDQVPVLATHETPVQGHFPPFVPPMFMGQPRLVGPNSTVQANNYSASVGQTPQSSRFRFVEEPFND